MDRSRPQRSAPHVRDRPALMRWPGLALLFLLALLALRVDAVDERGAPGLIVAQARFQLEGGETRRVELPHTWARDGLPNLGKGRYQVVLDLPHVPDLAWSLAAVRMATRCAIRVNGSLIHGAYPLHNTGQRSAPVPVFVDLPAALLHAGHNTIEIDVEFDARGGMSPLLFGPRESVRPAFARAEMIDVTVPQALNIGAVVLAVFMLTVWVRRRSEVEVGTFCALMAVVAVRNVIYTGLGQDWHRIAVDILLFTSNVASTVLLASFAMAFARREWPLLRRGVYGAGVVMLVVGGLGTWLGLPFALRVWIYPLLIVITLPCLWLIVLGARSRRGPYRVTLALAIFLWAFAGVHDYFFLRGMTSVLDRYWAPFASPLALLIFSWALLHRFVGALTAMETQAGELERKVAERTHELEVANTAKTRFLAAASHDLRQPVVSISLLSELLREQPLPATAGPILARIGDSVQALNGLLKGLLDLSRFDAGVVQARRSRVALRPLLDRVMGDEAEAARRKGIELRVRAAPFEIHSDPVLLEQVLRNLVGNAVRYTQRGGVLVGARRRGAERVLLQVWDTGPGIAAASRDAVFEEFVQLDNDARDRARGLGLGLSLVRRAASVLGVQVTLRSEPGRGSCFAIELPLDGIAPAQTQRSRPGEAGLAGRDVWVVEDDPDVREALRLRLAGWGATVRGFGDLGAVRQALADGACALPDLLLTDQRLPDGTGIEVAQLLQSRGAAVPVLLVTGDTAPHDIAKLRASGLPVLHKPFTSDELLAAVRGLALPT